MAKILNFNKSNENVIKFLEHVIECAKEDKADNVLVAYKTKNEEGEPIVMTGYCNLENMDKQELLGHIQVDIIKKMIDETYLI